MAGCYAQNQWCFPDKLRTKSAWFAARINCNPSGGAGSDLLDGAFHEKPHRNHGPHARGVFEHGTSRSQEQLLTWLLVLSWRRRRTARTCFRASGSELHSAVAEGSYWFIFSDCADECQGFEGAGNYDRLFTDQGWPSAH